MYHHSTPTFADFADSKSEKRKRDAKKKKDRQVKLAYFAAQKEKEKTARANANVKAIAARNTVPITKIVQGATTDRAYIENAGLTDRTTVGEGNLTERTAIVANAGVNMQEAKSNERVAVTQSNDSRDVEIADIREGNQTERSGISAQRDVAIQGDRQALLAIQVDRDLALREAALREREMEIQSRMDDRQHTHEMALEIQALKDERDQLDYERRMSETMDTGGETVDWDSDIFSSFSDEPSAFTAFMTAVNPNYGGPVDVPMLDHSPRPLMKSGHTASFDRMHRKRNRICRVNPDAPRCQNRGHRGRRGNTTFADYTPTATLESIGRRLEARYQRSAESVQHQFPNMSRLEPEVYQKDLSRPKKSCCAACAAPRPVTSTGCREQRCATRPYGVGAAPIGFNSGLADGPINIRGACEAYIDDNDWASQPIASLRPIHGGGRESIMTSAPYSPKCGIVPSSGLLNTACARSAVRRLKQSMAAPQQYVTRVLRRVNPLLF